MNKNNILDTDFLMSPKIDFCFKELMMKEEIRKSFISAVIEIPVQEIKSAIILNPYLRKSSKDEKQGILDVRIELNDLQQIDIEMQVRKLDVWADRSLFYTSKMFIEQIEEGSTYSEIHKCINISVLDFILFPEIEKFHSEFIIKEKELNVIYTDKMEWHIIELPKLPKGHYQNKELEMWARFFQCEKKEEFEMLADSSSGLKEAYDYLQIISADKEKRREYEERKKAILDYNAYLMQGKAEGKAEGRIEGKKEGRIEGKIEGRIEGRAKEIVESGYEFGFPENDILQRLQKKLNITLQQAQEYLTMFGKETK